MLLIELWPIYATIGAVIAAKGILSAGHAKSTWGWPLADAVITLISPVDADRPSEPGDSTVVYSIQVRYSYRVGNATYEGSHPVHAYGNIMGPSKAGELTTKYKLGRAFQVRYRPDRPQDHLAGGPENPGVGYGSAFFGAAMVVAGAILGTGASLWPLALGVGAAGVAGAVVWMGIYPREEVKEGLLHVRDARAASTRPD